jgi:microcystin-dependent protein
MTTPFVGEIRLFGFPRVPTGWFACDGSLLPISEYQALYAVVGTTYGGDGVTTFAVPDLRGRLPVHQGTGPGLPNMVVGQRAGSESVTLSTTQLPSHTHPMQATTADANAYVPGASVQLGALAGDVMYATSIDGLSPLALSPAAVSPAGGSQPHDNLMPTLTVSYCISAFGVYPSPA